MNETIQTLKMTAAFDRMFSSITIYVDIDVDMEIEIQRRKEVAKVTKFFAPLIAAIELEKLCDEDVLDDVELDFEGDRDTIPNEEERDTVPFPAAEQDELPLAA